MPTRTVPDQTMSLKTMVTKYVKGLPIAAPTLSGTYTGEDDATDFSKLDLAEQEEMVLRASKELSETKGRIDKEKAEKEAEARKQAEKDKETIKELQAKLEATSIKTT